MPTRSSSSRGCKRFIWRLLLQRDTSRDMLARATSQRPRTLCSCPCNCWWQAMTLAGNSSASMGAPTLSLCWLGLVAFDGGQPNSPAKRTCLVLLCPPLHRLRYNDRGAAASLQGGLQDVVLCRSLKNPSAEGDTPQQKDYMVPETLGRDLARSDRTSRPSPGSPLLRNAPGQVVLRMVAMEPRRSPLNSDVLAQGTMIVGSVFMFRARSQQWIGCFAGEDALQLPRLHSERVERVWAGARSERVEWLHGQWRGCPQVQRFL